MLVFLTYVSHTYMASAGWNRPIERSGRSSRPDAQTKPSQPNSAGQPLKAGYHHGELRQTLIDAARQLIHERDGNDFSLSDACRRAGVSTAAPYRHFADKTAIINAVVVQGFGDMTARFEATTAPFPQGAPERIVALGEAYLGFATGEPALFRMMFSQKATLSDDDPVTRHGKACFGFVVQEVVDYCAIHRVSGDAQMIALQLWTLVHGAAGLTIDGDYAKVSPDINVQAMIGSGAERLLFSLQRG
jgi:AcrR family transcriptional regulator